MPAKSRHTPKRHTGFTLLEVLMVVATCAILAGVVIIIVSPSRQITEAHNTQRTGDLAAIADALDRYRHDKGALPNTITAQDNQICMTGVASCEGLVDLRALTAGGKYLQALPVDPQCALQCVANGTGYNVHKDASDHVVLTAPLAEGQPISITK